MMALAHRWVLKMAVVGSYEVLAKTLTDFLPPTARFDALHEIFRSVVFSCIIENGDAHLKNFGLLYTDPEQQPYFAPAFDLVCTTAYIPEDHLALSLGKTKSFPDRERLMDFGKYCCQLSATKIKHVFDEIAEGISLALTEIAAQCDKFPEFYTSYGRTMQNIWERNLFNKLKPDSAFYISEKNRIRPQR